MRDYSKFSAIIIGAGVSTGSAITRKFAEMGYHVCPVRRERNFSELEKLAKGIQEAGYQATPYGVDARDEDAIAKLFKEVLLEYQLFLLMIKSSLEKTSLLRLRNIY